jgi:hypothetical protein
VKRSSLLDSLRRLLGSDSSSTQPPQNIPPANHTPPPTRPIPNPPPQPPPSSQIEWSATSSPPPPRQTTRQTPQQKAGIDWEGLTQSGVPDLQTLIGIEDAFDHTPLVAGELIAYCTFDKVAYHQATWNFLRDQNQGRCCICRRQNVIKFYTLPGKYIPTPVTVPEILPRVILSPGEKIIGRDNIREYLNSVVTVQDYVYEVYKTRASGTYFIRFEPRINRDPVYSGFKLVIFPEYQTSWDLAGISIDQYSQKYIRVRGLIQEHDKWGMEILVNSPRMIEIVKGPKS